jgi:GNAT superfamily N-acetyltransferase
LIEFFASHTEETIYQRYGYAGVHMTPEQAARLVSVDQTRDAALGVFELPESHLRMIAVGRYCLGRDGRWAEVAFVVHERRRGRGLGSLLLAALIAIARGRHLDRLVAEVRQDNEPMLHMLRTVGATFESLDGTAELKATLTLRAPESAAHSTSAAHKPPAGGSWAGDTAARAALRLEQAGIALHRLPMP